MRFLWKAAVLLGLIICIWSYITNTPIGQKGTPQHFHDAVLMGNYQEVKLALEANPELVNYSPHGSATPLHETADHLSLLVGEKLINKIEMVKLLINNGADKSLKDKAGETALDKALKFNQKKIADTIRNHGKKQ